MNRDMAGDLYWEVETVGIGLNTDEDMLRVAPSGQGLVPLHRPILWRGPAREREGLGDKLVPE